MHTDINIWSLLRPVKILTADFFAEIAVLEVEQCMPECNMSASMGRVPVCLSIQVASLNTMHLISDIQLTLTVITKQVSDISHDGFRPLLLTQTLRFIRASSYTSFIKILCLHIVRFLKDRCGKLEEYRGP